MRAVPAPSFHPSPRKPSFALPARACDAHVHAPLVDNPDRLYRFA
jgi:hypothetical protein